MVDQDVFLHLLLSVYVFRAHLLNLRLPGLTHEVITLQILLRNFSEHSLVLLVFDVHSRQIFIWCRVVRSSSVVSFWLG